MTSIQNKKYFCYEIYKNLSIWSRNGELGYNPCSFFKGYIKKDSDLNINSVWNSPEHNFLKHCVENDIAIPGCSTCYKQEASGLQSRRQGAKIHYESFHKDTNINLDSPQSIDYSVGNLCNLKCVICGPANSSQWIPDYQKLNPTVNIEFLKHKKFNQQELQDSNSLKNITSIHFHGGGEPLLSNNHINLLKKIDEAKGLSDVRVLYNVNGTQTVSDDVLKLWEKCKLIELYFSVDDIGERFNYQRTGANWSELERNLKWFYDCMPHNHMFKINCCWGYLNLYYLDELYDWWSNNFKTNRYGDHTNLIFQKVEGKFSIDYISSDTRNALFQKFKSYPELISIVNALSVTDRPHDRFWKNISRLDEIRNTSFNLIHPEWSKFLL